MPFQCESRIVADQDPGIERHRLARLEIELRPGILLHIEQELDQLLALVIGAGDVVPAAEIEPFELAEIGLKMVEQHIPGALERFEILFAQAVKMDAVDQRHMLFGQLVDRKAQPRMRGAGIIARHLAFGMQRIDPQPDVEIFAAQPRRFKDRRTAFDLHR